MTINPQGYFYRNKYLLALYDDEDRPVAIFDNPNDWSRTEGRKLNTIQTAISNYLLGKYPHVRYKNGRYHLHLIELTPEEMNEYIGKGGAGP